MKHLPSRHHSAPGKQPLESRRVRTTRNFSSLEVVGSTLYALRQRVMMLLHLTLRVPVEFTDSDCLFFTQLYHWLPSVLNAVIIIRLETLLRWHRAGFAGIGARNLAISVAQPPGHRPDDLASVGR